MFYYSKNSRKKIIHVRGCHYIQNTDEARLGVFKSIGEAYREGFTPCQHCSEMIKMYRKEKKKISAYKRENFVGIKLFPQYIEIKTHCSEWHIVPSPKQGKTHLYHKNYKVKDTDANSEIPGFHLQNVSRKSLKDYLDFIVPHDQSRKKSKPKVDPFALPKKVKGRSHKRYCKQVRAVKNRQRKKRIKELWTALENLSAS